jgi:hypothetical protein
MKKLLILFVSISILLSGCANQEEKEQNAKNSFYMDKPGNWYSQTDSMIYDNLSKFELSNAELDEMLKTHKGSVPLVIYTKYKPDEHAGMIPTIQVNLRSATTNDFKQFKATLIQSAKQFKNILNNFEYIDEPQEIDIAGIKSIYFKSKFDMPLKNGEAIKVRSWTYAIPKDSYFYQINFSDAFEEDDNSELFNRLIQSIKINDFPSNAEPPLQCAKEGKTIGASSMPSSCCSGLKAVGGWGGGYDGDCKLPPRPTGLSICAKCGNDTCDVDNGENKCNCEEDCK